VFFTVSGYSSSIDKWGNIFLWILAYFIVSILSSVVSIHHTLSNTIKKQKRHITGLFTLNHMGQDYRFINFDYHYALELLEFAKNEFGRSRNVFINIKEQPRRKVHSAGVE
jgi:hypothetical protein